MPSDLTIGQWLKLRRRGLGLTQRALGQRAGYSSETIRKVESDDLRPSRQMAERLADVLALEPAERPRFIAFVLGQAEGTAVDVPTLTAQIRAVPPRSDPAGPQAPAADAGLSPRQTAQEGPSVGSGSARPLPVPLTPFVGREAELAHLTRLLRDVECRLITLVGPGGSGKSRLALQAARAHAPEFAHGACFVPLASVASPALLPPEIAEALGLSLQGAAGPGEQLINFLREKHLLLILDNFEHLVDGAPYLIELLQGAPGVVVLVTSREQLRLQAEWRLDVGGLDTPPVQATDAEITGCSAVRLFWSTARRTDAGLDWSSTQLAAVARICRMVEGLPLAIELAAAWTPQLSLDEIEAAIGRDLDFLITSMRDVPVRHRSLRATFDASWHLLTDAERDTFSRLSIFQGGFRSDAAEAVAGASLPVLASLAAKSFLRRERSGRYQVHELLRQFGAEKLSDRGETEAARARHLRFYLDYARTIEPHLHGPDQAARLEQLQAELGNLRAALAECVPDDAAQASLELAGALMWFWHMRGYLTEGRRCLLQGLERSEALGSHPARAKALNALGLLVYTQGDFASAELYHQRSLAMARELGDAESLAYALRGLGNVRVDQGNFAAARTLFEECLERFAVLGDGFGQADALGRLAHVFMLLGNAARARDLFEQSLDGHRALGFARGIALSEWYLGELEHRQGNAAAARPRYERAVTTFRQLNDSALLALMQIDLGLTELALGDYAGAHAHFASSVTIFHDLGDLWNMPYGLRSLGHLAARQGDRARAEHFYCESLARNQALNDPRGMLASLAALAGLQPTPERVVRALAAVSARQNQIQARLLLIDQEEFDRNLAAARRALGDVAFDAAWAAGLALTPEQALAEALGE